MYLHCGLHHYCDCSDRSKRAKHDGDAFECCVWVRMKEQERAVALFIMRTAVHVHTCICCLPVPAYGVISWPHASTSSYLLLPWADVCIQFPDFAQGFGKQWSIARGMEVKSERENVVLLYPFPVSGCSSWFLRSSQACLNQIRQNLLYSPFVEACRVISLD